MTEPARARPAGGARSALGFLTIVGGAAPPVPTALVWFGPVGAVVGAAVGLTWWGASAWWSAFIAALLALTVDLVLTGLLHFDGLADSADGLLPPLDGARRLHVMSSPEVGAFAVTVVLVVLLLRVGGLASLPDGWQAVALTAGLWAGSRTSMAIALTTRPAARSPSLVESFTGASPWPPLAVGTVLAFAGVLIGRGWVGLVALVVGVAAAAAVVALAERRLGGITGDVLGAAGVLSETTALLVAAVDW